MKKLWNNKDRRRGLIGTILFHLALLLMFLFLGLTYYEPKPEDGIIINFGNSETGMGNEANEAVSPPEVVETPVVEQQQTLTQDVVEAPTIETSTEKPKPKPKEEKEPEPKPKEPEKPKPSDQLSKLLDNVENSQSGGEGVEDGPGDQGDPDGDPNSPNRVGGASGGGTGSAGDGNYLLGNRLALQKPLPDPCSSNNVVGRVVVKIYVDRNGNVSRAIPGEKIPGGKATTTANSCLYERAKSAAMRTKWQGDSEAPTLQIGYIVYNFQKK